MDLLDNIGVFEIEMGFNPRPQLHTHRDHEFFLCAEGSGTQHLENKTVRMEKDDFFFFPEGQRHIGNGCKNGRCTGFVLNIREPILLKISGNEYESGKLLSLMKANSFAGKIRISLNDRGASEIRDAYEGMIFEKKNRMTGCNLAAKSLLLRFLVAIARESKLLNSLGSVKARASSEDKIKEACRFIESNYMYRINVGQVAKFADLSRSHFHALFPRITGKSLIKFVNEIRVRKAIGLLSESNAGLEDISSSCGFTSLSHFYLVFRTETGRKPGDFRHQKKMTGEKPQTEA